MHAKAKAVRDGRAKLLGRMLQLALLRGAADHLASAGAQDNGRKPAHLHIIQDGQQLLQVAAAKAGAAGSLG